MRTALVLIFFLSLICTPLFASEANICSTEGLKGKALRICNRLCVNLQCGDRDDYYTTRRCVRLTDRFINITQGDMPVCLPRYTDGFYPNELYCYSNWEVNRIEQCDPLFNSVIDQYDVIDEADGTSEYEICLMNNRAQFDVCMLSLQMQVYAACSQQFTQPCYDEFDITGDNDALQACLEGVQWEIDACTEDIRYNFYFSYLFPDL